MPRSAAGFRRQRLWDRAHEPVGHVMIGLFMAALVVTAWLGDTQWWLAAPVVLGGIIAEWGDDA